MADTAIQSISGTPALNQFVYTANPYFDLEDFGPTYSTYPMYGNYGFGGSIFSAAPMYGGGLIGNNQDYFNQMRQYQQFYNDYNVDQQKMYRNSDLRVNASMEAIRLAYNALKDKIEKNEQGQIKQAFDKYVEAVANAYGQGSEQEIKARAATLYSQLSGGTSLVQDIRENGRGSFGQGFWSTILFGLYNAKSAEDNIAAITGSPVATSDKAAQVAGRITGAAAWGIGLGLINPVLGITAGILSFAISSIRGHSKS